MVWLVPRENIYLNRDKYYDKGTTIYGGKGTTITRNDPIDRQIKGFSFCNLEDDRQHPRSDFSLFSPRNLTFKHSLDAEIGLEDKESKRVKV